MNSVAQGCLGVRGWRGDACVEHCGRAIVENCAAAKNSVSVRSGGRGIKGNRLLMPVNHIGTSGMSPIHIAPSCTLRIVLVEHVVDAAVENGSVRIVHPIARGHQVKLRATRVSGKFAAEGGAVRVGDVGWYDERREASRGRRQRGGTGDLQEGSSGNCHFSAPRKLMPGSRLSFALCHTTAVRLGRWI